MRDARPDRDDRPSQPFSQPRKRSRSPVDREAERARKLQAMADDAAAEEETRKARLAEIRAIESKQDAEDEVKRLAASKGGQASFLKSAQKTAYGGDLSLADRVQRGRATLRAD